MHPSLTTHLTRAKPTHGSRTLPHLPMARACAWLVGSLGMLAAAPTLAQQTPSSTPTDNANVLPTVVISGQRLTSGDVAIGTDKVTSTVTISRDSAAVGAGRSQRAEDAGVAAGLQCAGQ